MALQVEILKRMYMSHCVTNTQQSIPQRSSSIRSTVSAATVSNEHADSVITRPIQKNCDILYTDTTLKLLAGLLKACIYLCKF